MTSAPFRFEPLAEIHDRTRFCSDEEALDRYFRNQVTQDVRRDVANCWVVIEASKGDIAGYYTLSAASIPLTDIPQDLAKRLPRYPSLPAVRIGRLAVDAKFQGRGLGVMLLMDAAHRTAHDAAAAFALLVDAKNDRAAAFYEHHGFRRIIGSPRTLFLPIATARKTLLLDRAR
jgi:ribosomal protein S18 acetylase RimI-like enzyme